MGILTDIYSLGKESFIMVDKIKELMHKYEEIIVYLIVGVMTTIVSWAACFIVERFWLDSSNDLQNFLINTIGWVVGVVSQQKHTDFKGIYRLCGLQTFHLDSGYSDYVAHR